MAYIDVKWRLAPDVPVGQALASATVRLREMAIEPASLDAQVLLAYVLGVDRSWLFAHYEQPLTLQQAEIYAGLITRRMRSEPVAYLTSHKEFYGLDFYVDQRVLIPRPETELLVDAVLDDVEMRPKKPVLVADVGTGSGAIAFSVAANNSHARLFALDISTDALAVAQVNAAKLGSNGQVALLQSDLLSALPQPVDIVVANLPYIANAAYQQLDATVRNYEPRLALVAGPAGLDSITRLLQQAPNHLNPAGHILLEIGHDQGRAVLDLARQMLPNAKSIFLEKDYLDHDRIVKIRL